MSGVILLGKAVPDSHKSRKIVTHLDRYGRALQYRDPIQFKLALNLSLTGKNTVAPPERERRRENL